MKNGAVIIPAAGSGTRMKLNYPKQFHSISGAPILIHTLKPFISHPLIDTIIVVVPEGHVQSSLDLLKEHDLKDDKITIIVGGRRRQDSVYNGLMAVARDTKVVLVHDGARPMVSEELISNCYHTALEKGAAIAALPVKDTLKKASSEQLISATIDREQLWQAQTPQAAQYHLLLQAFEANGAEDVTDEAGLLEKSQIPIHLIAGSESNTKVTRPEDILLMEALMQQQAPPRLRIGHGFDAHTFGEDRKLILGGVEVPYHLGLVGHSDADVLTHALCDALLGAIGAGDIGKHFPDNNAAFKDIYSITLLKEVMNSVEEKGYSLGNADITLICQAPKLASFLPQMVSILAKACSTTTNTINIKATTTEKMGFTGRGEGISCHAVVLLQG